jgi:hypothetical protein
MAYTRSVPAVHKATNQVHWTRVEIKLKSAPISFVKTSKSEKNMFYGTKLQNKFDEV